MIAAPCFLTSRRGAAGRDFGRSASFRNFFLLLFFVLEVAQRFKSLSNPRQKSTVPNVTNKPAIHKLVNIHNDYQYQNASAS